MMHNVLNNEDLSTLERQIEQLQEYKPIPEHEVKNLCDKVSLNHFRKRWAVIEAVLAIA